jgi:hypothetical protein
VAEGRALQVIDRQPWLEPIGNQLQPAVTAVNEQAGYIQH